METSLVLPRKPEDRPVLVELDFLNHQDPTLSVVNPKTGQPYEQWKAERKTVCCHTCVICSDKGQRLFLPDSAYCLWLSIIKLGQIERDLHLHRSSSPVPANVGRLFREMWMLYPQKQNSMMQYESIPELIKLAGLISNSIDGSQKPDRAILWDLSQFTSVLRQALSADRYNQYYPNERMVQQELRMKAVAVSW